MATSKFDSYKIMYYSTPNLEWYSIVTLFSGSQVVGRVNFINEGFDIPENAEINGVKVVNFHESRFDEVMDILRNEKPLRISIDPNIKLGVIHTNKEPAGEAELT